MEFQTLRQVRGGVQEVVPALGNARAARWRSGRCGIRASKSGLFPAGNSRGDIAVQIPVRINTFPGQLALVGDDIE
jgi:hypothetical protein